MPARIRKDQVKKGMLVTCKVRQEAYYSRRNGNPEIFLEPGEAAVVAAVNVPAVSTAWKTNGGTPYFVCVDFEKGGKAWRTNLYYNNISILDTRRHVQFDIYEDIQEYSQFHSDEENLNFARQAVKERPKQVAELLVKLVKP